MNIDDLESLYEIDDGSGGGSIGGEGSANRMPSTPMSPSSPQARSDVAATPGSQLSAVAMTPGRGGLSQGWVSSTEVKGKTVQASHTLAAIRSTACIPNANLP
jgi:hypothetical protein